MNVGSVGGTVWQSVRAGIPPPSERCPKVTRSGGTPGRGRHSAELQRTSRDADDGSLGRRLGRRAEAPGPGPPARSPQDFAGRQARVAGSVSLMTLLGFGRDSAKRSDIAPSHAALAC